MKTDTVPVRDGLFVVDDDDSIWLVAGRCASCDALHFPLAARCPSCRSSDVADERVGGAGAHLWGWTDVRVAPPGYRGPVPYGFGVVELDEGLRVVSRLTESDPVRLRQGQPMVLVLDSLHVDDAGRSVVTWAFAPEGV